jgi:hypothetical protein
MDLYFDVFKLEETGSLVWVGATASLTGAKAIAFKVHGGEPGCDFLVLDQRNGSRKMILHTELADLPRMERSDC